MEESGQTPSAEADYIHWVDFNVSYEALSQAYDYDIYPLTRFLAWHALETVRDDRTKEWSRRYQICDPEAAELSAEE